jgi:ABC-type multidrug transport system ATPase subunit
MMLLDEPTNHLDIEAIDSLAEAIKGFKVRGCFVVVLWTTEHTWGACRLVLVSGVIVICCS